MKIRFLLAGCLLTCSADLVAQGQQKGDASLRVEYQYVRTGDYISTIGPFDVGKTDSHALMLSADYALSDRIRVFASLPYIKKRHVGALPHDPVLDFDQYTPPDLTLSDDGSYHGDFQDFFFGMEYVAFQTPSVSISPYASYGLPTTNYPFYAHAAIGRNLWHMPIGVSVDYVPYFSDWQFNANVAWVITEKSLDIDVSHWLMVGLASYNLTPRFAPKVFVTYKYVPKGVSFPDDFPPESFDSEFWFFHDRTIRHSYTNAGIGFDLILNEKYQLAGTAYKMINPDEVNEIDLAFSFALTRYW